jgi:hypothetical protein
MLTYVGDGRAFRRLPAENLSDEAIEAAASRSLQSVESLTADLVRSGLYVVGEPKAKPKGKAKRKPKTP